MISAYLGLGLSAAAIADYGLRLPLGRAPFDTRAHDLVVGLGALLSISSVGLVGEPLWAAVAAGLLATSWFAVTRTQLRLPAKPARVGPGDPLPAFRVSRTDGGTLDAAAIGAAAPAVLVVYRGKW